MANKHTPVMQQYLEIKQQHEDALLFFRMGDFYEMFFEDAERAARLLDITLTSRNRNDPDPIPMCGVPYHSVRPYIAKLLEAGVKVAMCEQIELPERGIARREVTRVVTPGTSLDEEMLAPDVANYIAALSLCDDRWGLAWADFSTGEVHATELGSYEAAADELAGVAPSEIVLGDAQREQLCARLAQLLPGCMITSEAPSADPHEAGVVAIGVLEGASAAAWRLLHHYLARTQSGRIEHLRAAEFYDCGAFVLLDRSTMRNLEIFESYEGGRANTLLGAVDRAATPMGKRLLRQWLVRPLADADAIGRRLDAVEAFLESYELRQEVRETLRAVGDLERLAGRLGARTAGARDLVRLADSLEGAERLAALLAEHAGGAALPERLEQLRGDLDTLPELRALIGRAIAEEPPLSPGKGVLIREGYHEEVDRLRGVARDGKGWMTAFEATERKRTGIGNLKVGYNKVFGYFIEVSRAAHDRVPDDYERKQTLASAERYITADLKQREAEVLGAEERLVALESHLLGEVLADVREQLEAIARTAAALAALDVLAGLAETAHACGHVRPELVHDGSLEIVEGRHPVVEAALGTSFIPNDCKLSAETTTLMVITGPNMAGKSTYLRQVALVCLLAHCGAFVPAGRARISILDRIFTRIGASDNLARGQSTFMVEMSETAHILANMSERSLVVLDEIGRGTSTFDGISIAWAVAEAMVKAGVKTLFATHYHELAGLAAEHDRVANHSVAVRRYKGEIVFLYRVVEGATSGSYGIEVASLAGLPVDVIDNARAMLAKFETGGGLAAAGARAGEGSQAGLFDARPEAWQSELTKRLAEVNPEVLTPIDALSLLDRLVHEARKGQ